MHWCDKNFNTDLVSTYYKHLSTLSSAFCKYKNINLLALVFVFYIKAYYVSIMLRLSNKILIYDSFKLY